MVQAADQGVRMFHVDQWYALVNPACRGAITYSCSSHPGLGYGCAGWCGGAALPLVTPAGYVRWLLALCHGGVFLVALPGRSSPYCTGYGGASGCGRLPGGGRVRCRRPLFVIEGAGTGRAPGQLPDVRSGA